MYNWQRKQWPQFSYDASAIEEGLYSFSEKMGLVTGMLKSLPTDIKMDAIIETMVAEALKTSEIEGEFLSRRDVMSSIRNVFGLNSKTETVMDKRSVGISQMIKDVWDTYDEPLTSQRLFLWHTMVMGAQRHLMVGAWRNHAEPMQIVSGAIGREVVHYEAPPSDVVPKEMDAFINWFNETAPGGKSEIKKAPVRCAIAHLYFESIHPFEDGNGRIGRAIAEKALSQTMGRPALLSLSGIIESDKNAYYAALQAAEASLDITSWISYFVGVILAAQAEAESQIGFALKKTVFFDRYKNLLTERQLKVVRRMLQEGPKGFAGGMNARKYGTLTKVAKATATRDLQDLLEKGVLQKNGAGGRSTSYQLMIPS